MGYFTHGRLHRWGDPIALLRFPHLTPLQKLRYGLLTFISMRRERWDISTPLLDGERPGLKPRTYHIPLGPYSEFSLFRFAPPAL